MKNIARNIKYVKREIHKILSPPTRIKNLANISYMGSTRLHAAARDHMLDAYLYSNTDQHTAAGKPRFFVEHVSRFFTDIHCGQADESRRYADCQGGQLYIRVDHGKPDTDGKRIDTGCHPLYKEQRQRQIPSVYGFF